MNYYNEFEPKAAAALRQLIKDGLLPAGEVDTRSITDVRPADLKGFIQHHFFAGIGGWSVALDLAGWPADRPVWTGSCPCQPFSSAGKQKGGADDRDLWPIWFNLIRECRPASVYGEQVASAVSHGWLDRVYVDMERKNYACASAVLPACGVGAPHKRDRLWFVAHATDGGRAGWGRTGRSDGEETFHGGAQGGMADAHQSLSGEERQQRSGEFVRAGEDEGTGDVGHPEGIRSGRGPHDENQGRGQYAPPDTGEGKFWDDCEWLLCADGKIRRIPSAKPQIRCVDDGISAEMDNLDEQWDGQITLLAYGVKNRVGLLRALGNAIVPEIAARFIKATM